MSGGSRRLRVSRAPAKEILGWGMFDFANQAYVLLIITVIYPVLFTSVIAGGAGYRRANLLWSISLAASYLLVVFTGPVLGAVMDSRALKKRFLFVSWIVTIISTFLLYFAGPGMIIPAMGLLIISNFAYSSGENFIASFLPHLGPPQDLGKISGFGWALGYIGGLMAAGFAILFIGEVSLENYSRLRWTGPFAALFFLVAAIPTFLWLKEPGSAEVTKSGRGYIRQGFERVRKSILDAGKFRDLSVLYLSLFFTMAGIYIVIAFTFIYGDQVIGWSEQVRVIMFVVVQLSAAAGAVVFGALQDMIGAKKTYMMTLILWIAGILGIFGVFRITGLVNSVFGSSFEPQHIFVTIGVLAGASLGSSQSAGRSLVGIFTPSGKAAEFFGFWGLFNKLAGVTGLIGMGLLQALFGLRPAILYCAVLFSAAFIASLFIDQTRGEKTADIFEAYLPM